MLCLAAAAGVGYLVWQRQDPAYVDDGIFDAARTSVTQHAILTGSSRKPIGETNRTSCRTTTTP